MRVIAGKARRLPLVSPEGRGTRPTTDRIKETLFNILQDDILGCRFLDLFSGSGAIGIEAISRGAKEAVFVEFGKEALSCIRANLKKTKLESQAVVFPVEVSYAISKLARQQEMFDIIYADPPYERGFEPKILEWLGDAKIMNPDTILILETSLDTPVDYVDTEQFEIVRIKEYKNNQHVFLRAK